MSEAILCDAPAVSLLEIYREKVEISCMKCCDLESFVVYTYEYSTRKERVDFQVPWFRWEMRVEGVVGSKDEVLHFEKMQLILVVFATLY